MPTENFEYTVTVTGTITITCKFAVDMSAEDMVQTAIDELRGSGDINDVTAAIHCPELKREHA